MTRLLSIITAILMFAFYIIPVVAICNFGFRSSEFRHACFSSFGIFLLICGLWLFRSSLMPWFDKNKFSQFLSLEIDWVMDRCRIVENVPTNLPI